MSRKPDRRDWPAPLAAHLALTAHFLAQAAQMAPLIGDPRLVDTPAQEARRQQLAAATAHLPPEALRHLALVEAQQRLQQVLTGLAIYQTAPAPRPPSPRPKLLRQLGSTCLRDYGGTGPAVLVVPSLVNGAAVLDLTAGRSALRRLRAQGLRPVLLDWGQPGPEERFFTLSDYVSQRLVPLLTFLAKAGPVPVVGYCMGGSLALAAAQLCPQAVTRLALIGTPWDFPEHAGPVMLLRQMVGNPDKFREQIMAMGAALGAVPADLAQLAFMGLDPLLFMRKFAALPTMGPRARQFFVRVEDWLNAGPPLAAPAAAQLVLDWHLNNQTGRGTWQVAGQFIRPSALTQPLLVASAPRDRIVPPECSAPLAALAQTRLSPDGGHIGMVIGRHAFAQLWDPLAAWLRHEPAR